MLFRLRSRLSAANMVGGISRVLQGEVLVLEAVGRRRVTGVLAVLGSAAAMLGTAQVAKAGTLSRSGSGVLTYVAAAGEMNRVDIFKSVDNYYIYDRGAPMTQVGSGCSSTDNATWLYCGSTSTGTAPTGYSITLADGNDTVYSNLYGAEFGCCEPANIPVVADGGIGNDTLTGGSSTDTLDGGVGTDTINGGGGTDTASYASRSDGVTINLAAGGSDDGSQADGNAGARDNINNTDVEKVVGGDGADTITGVGLTRPLTFEGRGGGDNLSGGSAPNTLRGEGGNDTLTGGSDPDQLDGGDGGDTINGLAAADVVRGGSGFDSVEARDGIADDVDCGPDDDSAFTDPVDTRVSCDIAPTSTPSGGGGATTTTALPRLLITPSFTVRARRTATSFSKLTVKSVDSRSRVTAKCRTKRGRRCSRTRDFARSNAPATLRLRGFEKKSLPVGAKLEIRVTKAGMIGTVRVLTIRRSKKPSVTTRCLPPGATRPTGC